MRTSPLLAVSLTAALGAGLAACGDDPPPPSEVRARISSDLAHILREGNAAVDGSTADLPGAAATAMLDRVLGTGAQIIPRISAALAPLTAQATGGVRPADAPYDPAPQIALLTDKLFTDANYLGDGIFLVPAAVACAETTVDERGNPVETIDAACADRLAAAQLRVRVSERGPAIVFAIQLGAAHDEPLAIGLEPEALSVTVDLDDTWRAAVAMAKLLGQELPNAELAGQVTGRFEILGPARAKATLDIDRAVAIALAEPGVALDGPDALRFTSAPAKLFAIELDGVAQRGSLALGLGATTLQTVTVDAGVRQHRALDLPGVTAAATFGPGLPLALTGLSLGDRATTLTVDGRPAVAIELNRGDGRRLDAQLSIDPATGREVIEVAPRLDVRLTVDHGALGDELPVYDVSQLLLDGSLRTGATDDRLEVLTGKLRMVTTPDQYGFLAGAGQCVSAHEAQQGPLGRLYTAWTVGACP